jgi:nucleoside-diphosphate-sugar epimerase
MKILITGGLGHIGSYLLENINKIKFIKKVYVIDNFTTNRYCSLFNLPKTNKKIYFHQKDLTSNYALKNFRKVDIVIHLASLTDAAHSLNIKREIYRNNLGIFKNILKYCEKNSSKLVHISSTSVYGEQKGLVDENCKKLRPKSPYAEIKIKEENLLKKNKNKINFISYRFGTISGVSKGMRFHTAINKFCLCAALGKPLPVWKGMMNKPRPYLSLADAFKVFKFTIENNFFQNDIFNIVSQNLILKKIISYIKKSKSKIKIKYEKSKLINQYSYKVSNKKITKKGLIIKSSIFKDINSTLKILKNINSERT